ncbi:MAG: hypothetical protein ACJ8FY_16940 [Gemmataceae bacterium]
MFTSILALAEKSGLLLCFRPWAVVLGMMATASYFTGWAFVPHEPVTQANYEKIPVGMPINDVYQVLGEPNSQEAQKPYELGDYNERAELWAGERGARITVYFSDAGRVTDKIYKGPGDDVSTEEILWNWIGKWL